ncbi:uncharacterized protein LOC116845640 [Odontomachus brunneus]|uniref:uncharacterized protein LOC116845640 n=1 Tax=Odontomachus brunneus TaxID=486640 RepID=UPI0013F18494|nr:uncharacterized protein LOC116845640 [Odontomachus brunneus]
MDPRDADGVDDYDDDEEDVDEDGLYKYKFQLGFNLIDKKRQTWTLLVENLRGSRLFASSRHGNSGQLQACDPGLASEDEEEEAEKERGSRKEKEKGDGTRRRSAQPPITRCQRRQAVIRRLNSRSSRSVFVRVNLHQVSIFRAFRAGAGRNGTGRGEARRDEGEVRWTRRTARAATTASPQRRAKSTVTTTVINNTSKNNGENIGNERAERPSVATAKANTTGRSLADDGKYYNTTNFPKRTCAVGLATSENACCFVTVLFQRNVTHRGDHACERESFWAKCAVSVCVVKELQHFCLDEF